MQPNNAFEGGAPRNGAPLNANVRPAKYMSRNRLYWILTSSGLVGAAVIGAIAMSLLGYGHFDEQKMELTEVHAGLQPILDGLAPKFQEQGRLRALAPMRELSPLHLSQGRS